MTITQRQASLLKRTFVDFWQMEEFVNTPLIMERAQGLYYWDTDGKRYFDAIGGIFVATLGHGHPRLLEAARRQMEKMTFVPPLHGISNVALDFVEKIGSVAPGNLKYWAMLQQFRRNDRAGIEADRAARGQVAAAHGDEVGGTRAGTDEMHCHRLPSAIAQVTLPSTMRGPSSSPSLPATASAAASAAESKPVAASEATDRVTIFCRTRSSCSASATTSVRPSACAASLSVCSPAFCGTVATAPSEARSSACASSAASIAASTSSASIPARQPMPAIFISCSEDILLLDIHEISDFTDYFVICSGTSDRMLEALADEVMKHLRTNLSTRGRLEGLPQDGWLLIDYGDVIVHLFAPDRRNYYRLEELWGKGRVLVRLQ